MKPIIEFIKKFAFLLLMAILLLFLLVTIAFGQTPDQIKESLKLLEREQPRKAITTMESAVHTTPTPAGWFHLGYVQLKTGDRGSALQSFDKGIALNEKDPLNHAGKGYVLMLENKIPEAKTFLDRALDLSKSKNAAVVKTVAEAYLTNEKYAGEAVKLLERAQELDNKDPGIAILLGDAFLLQNNGGLAVTSYERAARLDPKDPAPHYKVAMVYVRTKNYPVAKEELNAAVTIDPTYTPAYKELGELYYLSKEGDKAARAQESYLRLTEKPEHGRLQYAFYLFMAKEYAKANSIFKQLITRPDASSTTYRFFARSLVESGDTLSSQKIFEQYFTKAKPEEIEAADYSYYGNMLKSLKQDSLALVFFGKSLAIDQNQPDVIQALGETYYKNRKYAAAVNAYELLITKRTKPLPQDYYSIGRAYYYNSQFSKADSAFTKLIELQPNRTVGYLWAGRSKANLDPETEQGLAKGVYEKLIEKALATPDKSKNELIEAYSYLGYYHLLKEEKAVSRSYWEKVLALNPADPKAKEALKTLQ